MSFHSLHVLLFYTVSYITTVAVHRYIRGLAKYLHYQMHPDVVTDRACSSLEHWEGMSVLRALHSRRHCMHCGTVWTAALHELRHCMHGDTARTAALHARRRCMHCGTACTATLHAPGHCIHCGSGCTAGNLIDLSVASSQYDTLLLSETLVTDMCLVSELPVSGFGR